MEITTLIRNLLQQTGSPDMAEAEFKRMINDDPDLKIAYREWCREVGSSEKNGFFDYCEELHSSQNDIWDSLNDFDE